MANVVDSAEFKALKQRIANTPQLSRLQTIFDENDEEKIVMLLDNPQMLDALIQMSSLFKCNATPEDHEDTEDEDENDPRFLLKKCMEINSEYFKTNSATDVCTQLINPFD